MLLYDRWACDLATVEEGTGISSRLGDKLAEISMENQELLTELESIALQLGIKLRYEKGDFEGGYCVLKSERIIVINKKLSPSLRLSVIARGINEIGLNNVYVKPAVRDFIEDEVSKAARQQS
jgi:hypothetical protein